jgi:integrase
MTKSTFRVLFLTQKGKPRPDGRVPVVTRITLNGQMAHFTTSVDVDPDRWLPKEGRTVGGTRLEKDANEILNDYRILIRQKYNDLTMNGEVVTANRVKQSVTSLDETSYSLLEICDRFIEDYSKLVATESVTQCTYQRYVLTRERLAEFIKTRHKVGDTPLANINYSFIKGFDLHNRIEHAAARFVKHFRTMFNLALHNGWVRTDPFASYKIQLEKVNRGYLTQEELDAMIGKEFTNKRLAVIRDMFLFSVYTGLAYVDVRQLTSTNIEYREDGSVWLTTARQKTNNPVVMPLLAIPAQIVERYKDATKDDRLLPIPSNQKVNDYLKEIATLCGIDKNLSFHTARHSVLSFRLKAS